LNANALKLFWRVTFRLHLIPRLVVFFRPDAHW
jgi:hypothetical protein